jgi:hypothetical protein
MFVTYIPQNASLSNINLSSIICHVTYTLLSFNTIFNFTLLTISLTILLVLPLPVILVNNTFEYRHSICDIVSKIDYVINEPGTT